MKVKLEFSGGMDLLFGNKKLHELDLQSSSSNGESSTSGKVRHCSVNGIVADSISGHLCASLSPKSQWTVGRIIAYARDNLLTERPELFAKGDSV